MASSYEQGVNLPFFAPVALGPYTAHCEPVGSMCMFWVYDTRKFDEPYITGLEACVRVDVTWPKTRSEGKRDAWKMRREWEESLV